MSIITEAADAINSLVESVKNITNGLKFSFEEIGTDPRELPLVQKIVLESEVQSVTIDKDMHNKPLNLREFKIEIEDDKFDKPGYKRIYCQEGNIGVGFLHFNEHDSNSFNHYYTWYANSTCYSASRSRSKAGFFPKESKSDTEYPYGYLHCVYDGIIDHCGAMQINGRVIMMEYTEDRDKNIRSFSSTNPWDCGGNFTNVYSSCGDYFKDGLHSIKIEPLSKLNIGTVITIRGK